MLHSLKFELMISLIDGFLIYGSLSQNLVAIIYSSLYTDVFIQLRGYYIVTEN